MQARQDTPADRGVGFGVSVPMHLHAFVQSCCGNNVHSLNKYVKSVQLTEDHNLSPCGQWPISIAQHSTAHMVTHIPAAHQPPPDLVAACPAVCCLCSQTCLPSHSHSHCLSYCPACYCLHCWARRQYCLHSQSEQPQLLQPLN